MANNQLPAEQISFDFEGEKVTISYPNNGQILDIEANKMTLSTGQYRQWMLTGSDSAINALNICDMCAVLTVLAPSLQKRLRVKNLLELKPLQTRKLSRQFAEKVLPWLQEWDAVLNAADDEDESTAGE
jgi:hypothetical protein